MNTSIDFMIGMTGGIYAALWAFKIGRSKYKPPFTDIIVVQDVNSPSLLIDTDLLEATYSLHENLDKKATFRLSSLSDKQVPEASEAYLTSGADSIAKNTENDYQYRFNEIETFYDEIQTIVDNSHAATNQAVTTQSECYRTIANELNIFSNGTATHQVLIVNSSLCERSDLLDCTSNTGRRLLFQSPRNVAKLFRKALPIGKIKGVKVVFLHTSEDQDDELRFMQMVDVYKRILKPRGATVSVLELTKNHEI